MVVNKLASAIYNEIVAGLAGYVSSTNMSLALLEDEVVEERLKIIKDYSLKNLVPRKDLFYSLNCVPVDCKSMDKCCINNYSKPVAHFEIPLIVNDFGESAIEYIGSTDKQIKFKVYTNLNFKYHKYRLRKNKKPYVYIDTTPNENNMYDAFLFDAPMLERLTVIAIFKDPRQLEKFTCCGFSELDNFTWISTETKTSLIKKKLFYYRQNYQNPLPNNQVPK